MKYLEEMSREEKLTIIRAWDAGTEHLPEILLDLQRRSKVNALDADTATLVAEALHLGSAQVLDLIGFYEMLTLQPSARWVLEVCRSNPCNMAKAQAVVDQLRAILDIEPYETTEDGLFTIRFMNCVGACDIGPVIRVGDEIYGSLTPEKIRALIDELRGRK